MFGIAGGTKKKNKIDREKPTHPSRMRRLPFVTLPPGQYSGYAPGGRYEAVFFAAASISSGVSSTVTLALAVPAALTIRDKAAAVICLANPR